MRINDIIVGLEQEIAEFAITDQVLVVKEILRASTALFLDTCFISRVKQFRDDTKLIMLFESIFKNYADAKKVIVVSSLVLYEMRDTDNKLSIYEKNLLKKLSVEGFKIVIMREETLSKQLSEYTSASTNERNNAFVKILCDNKANLSKLTRIVYSKPTTRKIYDYDFAAPYKVSFINDFISNVKEMKDTGDSLAEELIVLSIMQLAEYPSSRQDVLCTNDLSAIVRLNKSVCTSLASERTRISAMSMFTVAQAMIREGIVTEADKTVIRNVLATSVGNRIFVTEIKEPPLHSIDIHIGLDELVDGMFAGQGYILKGNSN